MPNENVLVFTGVTTNDFAPDIMLQGALKSDLDGVVIVGVDKEGKLFFSSSFADGADALWWIKQAELSLLELGRPKED